MFLHPFADGASHETCRRVVDGASEGVVVAIDAQGVGAAADGHHVHADALGERRVPVVLRYARHYVAAREVPVGVQVRVFHPDVLLVLVEAVGDDAVLRKHARLLLDAALYD